MKFILKQLPTPPEGEDETEWKIKPFPDRMVHITFINGHRYEGRMSRNKMEDEGVFTWNDGSRYEVY